MGRTHVQYRGPLTGAKRLRLLSPGWGPFVLRLRGPFSAGVRTGLAPFPGSLSAVSAPTRPHPRLCLGGICAQFYCRVSGLSRSWQGGTGLVQWLRLHEGLPWCPGCSAGTRISFLPTVPWPLALRV